MLKKLTYVLLFIGFILLILYIIPVPEKDITAIYKGDKTDLEGLLSFRAIPTKSIVIDQTNWEYLSIGKGERHLLFLHGMGGGYDIWWQQIEALKKDYHIISTTLPEVYSLDDAVAGVKAILDKEDIKKVSIIGSSMGGFMSQYFLKKYPEYLENVVFGNTFPPNDLLKEKYSTVRKVVPLLPEWFIMKQFRDDLSTRVTPYSENSTLVYAYLAEQYHGIMSKSQFVGRIEVVLGEFEPDYTVFQKKIPKLIIESDNDPLIPTALQKQLKTVYPNAQVHTFKNKGHFPYLNDAEKYTEVLRTFLMNEKEKAIKSTIHNYFEGRKKGDVALLKKAFHPNAKLETVAPTGEPLTIPLKDYFAVILKEGPVDCETELLFLTYNESGASATTSFDYGDRTYIDTLRISKTDGRWQIVNKAFYKK